ncbi:MAG: hypothetical protein AAFX54_11915 [Pseudomonadota bacterium]
MSALNSILENFEPDAGPANGADDVRSQQLKAAAYAEGFSAGEAAAKAKHDTESAFFAEAADQISQALGAMPQRLNEQLAEALSAIMHKTLPTLAAKGFADEVTVAVLEHVDTEKCGSLVIKTSTERVDELTAPFAAFNDDQRVRIEADPELSGSMVAASWESAGLDMDVETVAQNVLKALDKYVSQFKKET